MAFFNNLSTGFLHSVLTLVILKYSHMNKLKILVATNVALFVAFVVDFATTVATKIATAAIFVATVVVNFDAINRNMHR
jgi:hypothetical protein